MVFALEKNGPTAFLRLCRPTDDKLENCVITDITDENDPYDSKVDFLSRFPIGFQGYYNCSKTDHNNTRDFELARGGNFNKRQFFSEIWAHKPHTRIIYDSRTREVVQKSGQINVMISKFYQNRYPDENYYQNKTKTNSKT